MSTFTYKLIATIFMFIDHLAASFQISNNGILSYEVLSLMRSIGRVSLPIFAYFLVVSYGKTRDIHKYISRLHLGAIISQVPFSLLFNQSFYGNQSINLFSYQYENLIFTGLIIVSYFLFITKRKFTKDLFIVGISWILASLNIVYKGVYIFNPTDLNIFYEFGLSIIVIYLLDEINQEFRITSLKNIFAIMVIIGLSFYLDRVGNYGFSVLLLIMLLFAYKNNQYIQCLIIMLWGFYMYSYNITNVIFVILAGISLLFYNGQKGRGLKSFFYIFYPMHMIILIFLSIIISNIK